MLNIESSNCYFMCLYQIIIKIKHKNIILILFLIFNFYFENIMKNDLKIIICDDIFINTAGMTIVGFWFTFIFIFYDVIHHSKWKFGPNDCHGIVNTTMLCHVVSLPYSIISSYHVLITYIVARWWIIYKVRA